MGVVFLADQPALARTVAIKLLHPSIAVNRLQVRRFCEEAVAASQVHHPQAVTVLDHGYQRDGTPFIVMEHVPGRLLSKIGDVSVPRALKLVDQLLDILAAAHASGVVHADVKSDNVIVDDEDRVTLIDFGLARVDGVGVSDELVTECGVVSGTPEYMAPELALGDKPTKASDLYAVGVILYELLTGAPLFEGRDASAIIDCHLDEIVRPPSLRRPERAIPTALDRVVLRALAKRPQARFKDAAEFARALAGAIAGHISLHLRCRACGVDGDASARFCAACGTRIGESCEHADTEAPTRNVTLPPERRLARGSECSLPDPIEDARRGIGVALACGDVAAISNGYLKLAVALVAKRRLAAARSELAEGIDILGGNGGRDASEHVGQLVAMLTNMCE
jgi:serine/threonine-protein kinase